MRDQPPGDARGHAAELLRRPNLLRAAAKALGVAFLVYVIGEVVRMFNPDPSCTDEVTCGTSSSAPSDGQLLLVAALVFALAFCTFLIRANRRKY
jgi:hypothetical protein